MDARTFKPGGHLVFLSRNGQRRVARYIGEHTCHHDDHDGTVERLIEVQPEDSSATIVINVDRVIINVRGGT